MLHTATAIAGYRLGGRDGELGRVKGFYFDDRSWEIRYLVANTRNWLTGITVLIAPHALMSVSRSERLVSVDLTREQIERSPALSGQAPVSEQFKAAPFGTYGSPIRGFVERDGSVRTPGKGHDPHLRSTDHVRGYHLQATDGEIGHVDDFIIDDATWAIRYLVIATHNWRPGKRVLIAPAWIERVSWSKKKVFVGLTSQAIQQSPEYTAASLPTREYETGLHGHYDRPGYWVDAAAEKPDAGGNVPPKSGAEPGR